jgi:hypothetical protein
MGVSSGQQELTSTIPGPTRRMMTKPVPKEADNANIWTLGGQRGLDPRRLTLTSRTNEGVSRGRRTQDGHILQQRTRQRRS